MPNLTYQVSDFLPFTKIVSADVNSRFNDIKVLLNTTGLDDTNLQNAGITRATKLKTGTANYVLVNGADGTMSEEATLARSRGGIGFAPTLTGNQGKALTVNAGETAFELGTPTVDIITESLASHVATLTAGEAILANDAVCVDLNEGAYKVFQCDSDLGTRKNNFLGFATNAATVTPSIRTYTLSAALVASNVVTTTINGRVYSTTYASSSDATLQAVATQIATDADIASAVVTVVGGSQTGVDDRVITVTGRGALTINISAVVTLGASQPTVAVASTQSPVGGNVQIRVFGPMSGFSGLTVGNTYYLSSTSGGITASPLDASPIKVGSALSSTVLFVNQLVNGFAFPGSSVFFRLMGATTVAAANAVATTEQFNFSSWSAGPTATVSRWLGAEGECQYSTQLYYIDGANTTNTITLTNVSTNKTSWTTNTNRTTAHACMGVGQLGGFLCVTKGTTNFSDSDNKVDKYNGASWTVSAGTFATSVRSAGTFVQGALLHAVGGYTGAAASAAHDTWNGTAVSTGTAYPVSDIAHVGAANGNNGIAGGGSSNGVASYLWSGSWSASITMANSVDSASSASTGGGCASGYSSNQLKSYTNGGNPSGGTATAATQGFNGSAWAVSTSSSTATSGATGGVV